MLVLADKADFLFPYANELVGVAFYSVVVVLIFSYQQYLFL